MDEVPLGFRSAEDESLFKNPTEDPAICSDKVSPAVEGYFRIPAVWVGEPPNPESVLTLNPRIHHAVVFKMKLHCGIEVRVQRDGTFLFNFSTWRLAPQILIPGYRIPNPGHSHRAPAEHISAENEAEEHAVLRAQTMNVHQACLATSEKVVKERAAEMGFPLTAWNTLKAISFETAISYADDTEDVRALTHNVLNNKDQVYREQPHPRRVLELDVIEHSLAMLDQILSAKDQALIQMIEAVYLAACRCTEKRFGEAITLAWGVCEQLLSSAWQVLIDDIKASDRMRRKRKDKLEGRDYTVSVITEILEMNDRIDHDLYLLLEDTRKARNNWAHKMHIPTVNDADKAIGAAERLFRHVKGIHISLGMYGRGGVPMWNIWIWDEVNSRGAP